MSTSVQPAGTGQMAGRPSPTGLADVIDTILDKGLVIDAYVRVSLVGIEILTIDARVVVASVDTYLRFAEAANRLDLAESEEGLTDVLAATKGGGKPQDMVQGSAAGELTGQRQDEPEVTVEREPRESREAPRRRPRVQREEE
ncbi:Gas vesicle protein [Nonomuraea maritima]|uniref:Gas vesicle protein A n=1 Tax=Nonomuraea maritima TaxID=683260 RepID=A0A1G9A833_9ACTN|nr:gas vesicle protein GvpJ [Nonomuraea maritima]SDK23467.1 Gas vesicle protein [Nonomuraea maritima]